MSTKRAAAMAQKKARRKAAPAPSGRRGGEVQVGGSALVATASLDPAEIVAWQRLKEITDQFLRPRGEAIVAAIAKGDLDTAAGLAAALPDDFIDKAMATTISRALRFRGQPKPPGSRSPHTAAIEKLVAENPSDTATVLWAKAGAGWEEAGKDGLRHIRSRAVMQRPAFARAVGRARRKLRLNSDK